MKTTLIALLIASIYFQWIGWYQSMKLIQAANINPIPRIEKISEEKYIDEIDDDQKISALDVFIKLLEILYKELKKIKKNKNK